MNSKPLVARGFSGDSQYIDWIGTRAEIFCSHKDAEAPLMSMNRLRLVLRVHPIAGELFLTVKALIPLLHDSYRAGHSS